MRQLSGKNALLTGASRGIGRSIARGLAERGVNLALAARSADELEDVRTTAASAGVRAVAIPTDVADAGQRQRLVDQSIEALGSIDILINNAGIESVGSYHELPPQEVQRAVDVNLVAPMFLTQAVLPAMLQRRSGHVVNIASLAGKGGIPFGETYSATKFGLVGFTASLRASYADSGVGFSVVCPGFISDEGMYARQEAAGARAPRALGKVSPDRVVTAVIDAIVRDRGDVVVNSTPVRPLFALQQLVPALDVWFLKRLGVIDYFRSVAEQERR